MKRIAALGLLLAAFPASAQQAAGPQESMSCDSPVGRMTRYHRIVGPAPLRFDAVVKVNQLRTDTNWLPVVAVALNGGKPELNAGFRLVGDAATGRVAIFAIAPGMKPEDGTPFGEVGVGQPIALGVVGTDKGSQFGVNGITRPGPALAPGNWLFEISCSTIDAGIDALVTRPPAAPASPAPAPQSGKPGSGR